MRPKVIWQIYDYVWSSKLSFNKVLYHITLLRNIINNGQVRKVPGTDRVTFHNATVDRWISSRLHN